ncbi:MAG: YfcE family phosphodiesterase [Candidatus Coatesbacteria bacterium]|nr:MAG: YfcE family phosphodiesterase [Candidatus Coatesbacteria bacterium]
MKIGILADTHDHIDNTQYFLEKFYMKDVHLVIFAGDLVSPFAISPFKKVGIPVKGVFGNNEGERELIRHKFKEVGFKIVEPPLNLKIEEEFISLFHRLPHPIPDDIDSNIIIFAHTHRREVKREGGRLLINPGEVCGWVTGEATAVILSIPDGEIEWIFKVT